MSGHGTIQQRVANCAEVPFVEYINFRSGNFQWQMFPGQVWSIFTFVMLKNFGICII